MNKHYIIQLSNGIRVVHKQNSHSKIAHCGFILDIGSRDEKEKQQGLAHFWEHMAFKGTNKRKAFHIINRLEAVGGELNAYTTKEKICFYASFLTHHYEKAIELLSDITFFSTFPENQIQRERNVILEEMAMYEDSPEDAIQDEFDEVIFGEHQLGKNILGTKQSVATFQRQDFYQFLKEHLNTESVVFSSVGNIPLEKVQKLVEKYLSPVPPQYSKTERVFFKDYQVKHQEKKFPGQQTYVAIGKTAYAKQDEKRLPFLMLNNILGGPGLNSRLNLALRERKGLVYAIDANYNAFVDTGLWAIFFATERRFLEKSIKEVLKEIKNLREKKLGIVKFHQAQEQMLGQLIMAEENNLAYMLMMGKSLLEQNRIESLEDIIQKIKAITAEELQEIAQEIWQEDSLSTLFYLPQNQ